MNESVGYTVTINIIITFIVIVFVFLSNVLIYYKSNKVGNVIVDSIEKYSGFNNLSENEINIKLESLGYNKTNINCPDIINCTNMSENTKDKGYCVYYCQEKDNYYHYKVKTNMIINIPIINNILNMTVLSSTGNIYNFKGVVEGDIDGDGELTSNDSLYIKRYLNEFEDELDISKIPLGADVNNDKVIDCKDACYIDEILVGKNGDSCNGKLPYYCIE